MLREIAYIVENGQWACHEAGPASPYEAELDRGEQCGDRNRMMAAWPCIYWKKPPSMPARIPKRIPKKKSTQTSRLLDT